VLNADACASLQESKYGPAIIAVRKAKRIVGDGPAELNGAHQRNVSAGDDRTELTARISATYPPATAQPN
jgi:hypothetical protein